CRDTFPDRSPVVFVETNSATVAGAAPALNRLPNYPVAHRDRAPKAMSSKHRCGPRMLAKATPLRIKATAANLESEAVAQAIPPRAEHGERHPERLAAGEGQAGQRSPNVEAPGMAGNRLPE